MLQVVLLAGKFVLLIILYLFIYRVVRSSMREFQLSASGAKRHHGPGAVEFSGAGDHAGAARAAETRGMTWTLVVIKSPNLRQGEIFAFAPGSRAVVGRSADMEIYVDDTFASSKHALFEAVGGVLKVEDLHSTNGTLVNGREVTGVRDLSEGDRIEIGETVFEVQIR